MRRAAVSKGEVKGGAALAAADYAQVTPGDSSNVLCAGTSKGKVGVRANWQTRLMAASISAALLFFFAARTIGNGAEQTHTPVNPVVSSSISAQTVNFPQHDSLDVQHLPPHSSGRVELYPAGPGHIVAYYRNCAVLFEARSGNQLIHIDTDHSSLVGITQGQVLIQQEGSTLAMNIDGFDGEWKNPAVSHSEPDGGNSSGLLARMSDVLLYRPSLTRLVLRDERNGRILADRNGPGGGELLFADGEMAIISYFSWDADIRVIEALSRPTGSVLWTYRYAAAGWPVLSIAPFRIYFPAQTPRGSLYYQNEYTSGKPRDQNNSIIRIDPRTGEITGKYRMQSGFTSLVEAEGGLYFGTDSGEIIRISEEPTDRAAEHQQYLGSLQINTEPTGAAVTLCGRRVGTSPAILEKLIPGTYAVAASAGGRESESVQAIVQGNTSVNIVLLPALQIRRTGPVSLQDEAAPDNRWEVDGILIQYSPSQGNITATDRFSGQVRWRSDRVVGPVAVADSIVVYSISFDTGDSIIRYLVAHRIDVSVTRRKPLHLWQAGSAGSISLDGGRAYVADGSDLSAYNLSTASRLWKTSAGTQIDAIFGVIAGSIVSAEAGDLVCRDLSTGTETLRFQAVFEPNLPVPRHAFMENGIVFAAGLELTGIRGGHNRRSSVHLP